MASNATAQPYSMERDHGVLVVELQTDSITGDQLLEDLKHAVIERLPEAENAVLFDCRRLTGRVTSQFLATLVSIRRRAVAHGVLVCLCSVKGALREAYDVLEREMAGKTWTLGDRFTLADCAAAPALFYANTVAPFGDTQRHLAAYLNRLMARPSFAQVLKEAQPYFSLFPMDRKPQIAGAGVPASP